MIGFDAYNASSLLSPGWDRDWSHCANIRLPGATKNEGLGLYDQRHL